MSFTQMKQYVVHRIHLFSFVKPNHITVPAVCLPGQKISVCCRHEDSEHRSREVVSFEPVLYPQASMAFGLELVDVDVGLQASHQHATKGVTWKANLIPNSRIFAYHSRNILASPNRCSHSSVHSIGPCMVSRDSSIHAVSPRGSEFPVRTCSIGFVPSSKSVWRAISTRYGHGAGRRSTAVPPILSSPRVPSFEK